MKILQVSPSDIAGGAEKIAFDLFQSYRQIGHRSWLAVDNRKTSDPDVHQIPKNQNNSGWAHFCLAIHGNLLKLNTRHPAIEKLKYWIRILAGGWSEIDRERGREDFNYPGSQLLLRTIQETPDIIHLHNLHGNYFDLRFLPKLTCNKLTFITLHDEWMLTGHCACTIKCQRWITGCGQCPDLNIYPAVLKDATAWNWKRKKRIYHKSSLHVITPSRWLLERVNRSMLHPITSTVIPNGVNHSIFHPADRTKKRQELQLPQESKILLFAAHKGRYNPFRNYLMTKRAADLASNTISEPVLFIVLGGDESSEEAAGNLTIRHLPMIQEPTQIAKYYQAADLYLHAAISDNFPTTVLEALSCGVPTIATAIGGIPEQINHARTGFLVPPGDEKLMALWICKLLEDDPLRQSVSEQAAAEAKARFSIKNQAQSYLDRYKEILDQCE